jgi:glycine cleavage system H lipoate-binding protein
MNAGGNKERAARPGEAIMSILFVLLMFLLIMTASYLRTHGQIQPKPEVWVGPTAPRMEREYGFAIPQGYSFHPGHTWVMGEGGENTRVGIDSFAANLMGKIDRVDTISPNRWIRQGQRLITIKSGEQSVDLLSPVEGVVTAINQDLANDPSLANRSPYKDGWVAVIKSPDFAINQKNLIQGQMVAPWMQNNVTRLNALVTHSNPALAQDGGQPVSGILERVNPEVRQKIVAEFFLN